MLTDHAIGEDSNDDLNRIDLEIDPSHQWPPLTPEQIEYLRKIEDASRYNPYAVIGGPDKK